MKLTAVPFPSKVNEIFDLKDEEGNDIGELIGQENAAEIVKRVNLYDELVEALDEAEAFLGAMFGQGPDAIVSEKVMLPLGVECDLGSIVRDLKATLAKARA
jgi:hypothetical protein